MSRLHLLLNIENFLLKKYITDPSLLPSQLLPYVTTGFSNVIPKEKEQHVISFLTNKNNILDLYLKYHKTNQDTLKGPLFVPLLPVFDQINLYFQDLDSFYRKSYTSYRKILEFLTSALNIQHPGIHKITKTQLLSDITFFFSENPKYADTHYFLNLYKLIVYPEESATLKLPLFTKEQLTQITGYFAEHYSIP